MKIKKGDKVKVITGHEKGVVGEVLACFPKENRIVVEGVNIRKVAQKPSQLNQTEEEEKKEENQENNEKKEKENNQNKIDEKA